MMMMMTMMMMMMMFMTAQYLLNVAYNKFICKLVEFVRRSAGMLTKYTHYAYSIRRFNQGWREYLSTYSSNKWKVETFRFRLPFPFPVIVSSHFRF